MKIREMPAWEMPREKLLRYGKENLSTAELLAILLRTGNRHRSAIDLAYELLAMDSRGLRYIAECTPEELASINGVGKVKACQILAAIELGRRIAASPLEKNAVIKSSGDIADIFMEKLRYEKKEHFFCVMMNAKGEIIEEREVSIGDLNSSQVHPREVFAGAVRRSAGCVAFVHNHPSGSPTPSQDDIDSTKRLVEAGRLLGIPVLDHIIIGDGTYASMKAEGLL
ncbi:MAG: DNA repair protein RadC [Firmicutes bacterium]|nr:DNA repair protein RadC [Bacillota bacterium]